MGEGGEYEGVGDGGDVFVTLLAEVARCSVCGGLEWGDEQDSSCIVCFAVFFGNLFIDRPGKDAYYSAFPSEEKV